MGEQSKRKDRFHLEVETESICLRVSDRTVPPTLSLWTKLTCFSPCANKFLLHITSLPVSCLLIVTLCLIKTHTNKYKTHHKAKGLSAQEVYPRMYQCQLQSRILQPLRGAISMPGLKRDQMSHGVREKMSAQTQHTIFLG